MTKYCNSSINPLLETTQEGMLYNNISIADCIFQISLPHREGWGESKKEGRLTTTIFTNLKSYTMKNTMQR